MAALNHPFMLCPFHFRVKEKDAIRAWQVINDSLAIAFPDAVVTQTASWVIDVALGSINDHYALSRFTVSLYQNDGLIVELMRVRGDALYFGEVFHAFCEVLPPSMRGKPATLDLFEDSDDEDQNPPINVNSPRKQEFAPLPLFLPPPQVSPDVTEEELALLFDADESGYVELLLTSCAKDEPGSLFIMDHFNRMATFLSPGALLLLSANVPALTLFLTKYSEDERCVKFREELRSLFSTTGLFRGVEQTAWEQWVERALRIV